MALNPYTSLPPEAFWKTGVEESSPLNLQGIYEKKWPIESSSRIATAGSCFAQHIARFLGRNGYSVLDLEPAPLGLPGGLHLKFGYSMYSARFGNIYTVRQLLQLAEEAAGQFVPSDAVWEKGGKFYDAFRPAVEPEGLASPEEVLAHRRHHLSRVRAMLEEMDLFIFTLGLTEAWCKADDGCVFPTAPGTIVGAYASDRYRFKNFSYTEIIADFREFVRVVVDLRGGRPFRRLLTVSPVPLTATASHRHVLAATTYSKSVLRAVAGDLAAADEDTDYFPSYEIVTNPGARGVFYQSNLREVTTDGVGVVMDLFFGQHRLDECGATAGGPEAPKEKAASAASRGPGPSAVQCEESLLEAFRA